MSHRTLPYLPFAVFVGALDAIAKEPPEQIDRSCWSRFRSLNKNGRALFDIFRYFRLVSVEGDALPQLREILDVRTRSDALAAVLRTHYNFVLPESLSTATMDRLKKVFEQSAGSETMGRKALSFYLNAAQQAGFELHGRLVPRGPRVRNKNAQPAAARSNAVDNELTMACRKLEAGGILTVIVSGQPFKSLTAAELQMATDAALALKGARRVRTSLPAVRRPPGREKNTGKKQKFRPWLNPGNRIRPA